MNETESEARRLLTAGTSDMPEGIDLLDGFTRTRSRTRRRRGRAVATAGVAVAAVAVTAGVTLTAGPAPSALAAVTTALNRALTGQSYSDTDTSGIYYINTNGKVYARSSLTCTAEQNPARGLAESYCPGDHSIQAGGYYYYTSHERGDRSPYDKYWWAIDLSRARQFPFGHQSAFATLADDTPQMIASVIRHGAKVSVVGPVSGPGWTGTRYAFTWTGKPGKDGTITLPPEVISGTVDVDQQGRARVLVYNDRSTAGDGNVFVQTYDMTFSDFGMKVTITPPPASQTYVINSAA
jgi:hypothetical protein